VQQNHLNIPGGRVQTNHSVSWHGAMSSRHIL